MNELNGFNRSTFHPMRSENGWREQAEVVEKFYFSCKYVSAPKGAKNVQKIRIGPSNALFYCLFFVVIVQDF